MCRKYLASPILVLAAIAVMHGINPPGLAAVPQEVFEGVVDSVSRNALTIRDDLRLVEGRFATNQSTKIMRNGKLARLNDIMPGDVAKVTARPLGDKLLALTITAMTPR